MDYDPHVKKLAEGKTEITTKMICEAELKYREEKNINYSKEHYYNVLMFRAQNMILEERQRYCQHMMSGGSFNGLFGYYPYSICPYCGR